MKRLLAILLVLLSVMVLTETLWRWTRRQASELPATPASQSQSGAQAPAPPARTKLPEAVPVVPAAAPAPVVPPAPPLPPDHPARTEADDVARNLRHFGQRFGGNPVGTNAEIVRYLNGGNPHGVRYLPQETSRLNEAGELVDSWGTPYFFHQLSAKETEIRSAGPDRTLWTGDDIVAK